MTANAPKFPDTAGAVTFAACIDPFQCQRKIDLRGSKIGGHLTFRGAMLNGTDSDTQEEYALDLASCKVGGNLLFSPYLHLEKEVNRNKRRMELVEFFFARGRVRSMVSRLRVI
ncbi:MAG: hypothetical protein WDN06_11775 [Asticcacaulis sp.]